MQEFSLEKHLNQKDVSWFLILQRVVYEYNISFHSAISSTPFEIFKGRSGYNFKLDVNLGAI